MYIENHVTYNKSSKVSYILVKIYYGKDLIDQFIFQTDSLPNEISIGMHQFSIEANGESIELEIEFPKLDFFN